MSSFVKLINEATENGRCIDLRFDPEERGEEWEIKYYIDSDYDCYYYACDKDLESSATILLNLLHNPPDLTKESFL
jgi:hypothetical protein